MSASACAVNGCERPSKARNWCGTHWLRWRKYGDPLGVSILRGDVGRRFWSKVDGGDVDQCWEWRGSRTTNGYGCFGLDYKTVLAHRWAYEDMRAEIPEGLQIDHLCRNRVCVNPWHLEPVTARVNTLRNTGPSAVNATKTACLQGHPLDGDNVRMNRGSRICKTCAREAARRKRADA